MIIEVFPSGPAETNAYLIACPQSRRAAVIDVPFGSTEPLLKKASTLQVQIEKILLTHSHWDHTAEVALLKEKTGASVYIHREDEGNLKEPGSDRLPLLFPIAPAVADGFLSDGEKMLLGQLEIQVLHTPGHTPGGVCFYIASEGVLFSGDTLFRGTMGNLSFPTARPEKMWGSLRRLAALPKETKVYPGHGPSTTIGHEGWIARAEEFE